MNFNFGQLRKNNANLYSNLSGLKTDNVNFEIAKGQDIQINTLHYGSGGLFQKDDMYALRFNCRLIDENGKNLSSDAFAECEIFLSSMGSGRVDNNKKMIIKILPIVTRESQQVTILFSPKLADFTHICFYLKNKKSNDDEKISDSLCIEQAEFYALNNLIENEIRNFISHKEVSGDGTKVTIILKKIGLQGATGLPFMINGEEFKIGKSEIFTSDDIIISSLGIFAVKNNNNTDSNTNPYYEDKNFFVLDYEYEEIGGSE